MSIILLKVSRYKMYRNYFLTLRISDGFVTMSASSDVIIGNGWVTYKSEKRFTDVCRTRGTFTESLYYDERVENRESKQPKSRQ